MKLNHEFFQLPLSFDINRMKQEVSQFTESEWSSHHEGFDGNSAIPLVSVRGEKNNEFKGPMRATQALKDSPYLQQVIASFGEIIGRSRLMRLAPGAEVPLHSDINYHWNKRVRIHIPIQTTEEVIFYCADKKVHMAEGDCWIFDSWKYHRVINNSNEMRTHLVIDIIGSSRFWKMIREQSSKFGSEKSNFKKKHLTFESSLQTKINTENINFPIIMDPSEIENLTNQLITQIDSHPENQESLKNDFIRVIKDFSLDWQEIWSQYSTMTEGWPRYHQLRQQTIEKASSYENKVFVNNKTTALKILIHLIISPSMSTELASVTHDTEQKKTPATENPQKSTSRAPITNSRNSLCHCGSNKKFKHCHGQIT